METSICLKDKKRCVVMSIWSPEELKKQFQTRIVDIPFHIFFLETFIGLFPAAYITVRRKWYRNFLMKGFHLVVLLAAGSGVCDTCKIYTSDRSQELLLEGCGFTMFTRATAGKLFTNIRLRRYNTFIKGLEQVGITCLNNNACLFFWMDLRHLLKDHTFE